MQKGLEKYAVNLNRRRRSGMLLPMAAFNEIRVLKSCAYSIQPDTLKESFMRTTRLIKQPNNQTQFKTVKA